MNEEEKATLCDLLLALFIDCAEEETDLAHVTMKLPERKKQVTAYIKFDIEDMGGEIK